MESCGSALYAAIILPSRLSSLVPFCRRSSSNTFHISRIPTEIDTERFHDTFFLDAFFVVVANFERNVSPTLRRIGTMKESVTFG